jgi:hypothetical protein
MDVEPDDLIENARVGDVDRDVIRERLDHIAQGLHTVRSDEQGSSAIRGFEQPTDNQLALGDEQASMPLGVERVRPLKQLVIAQVAIVRNSGIVEGIDGDESHGGEGISPAS